MCEQLSWEEAGYRLVHDERYLDAFLERDGEALRLNEQDLARLYRLDSGAVLWAARGKRLDVQRRLQEEFKSVFARWELYMDDGGRGHGLVSLFLRSGDYRAFHEGCIPLHEAFRHFAMRTSVFAASLLEAPESLVAK